MFSRIWTNASTKSCSEQIERLRTALRDCDAVVVGAGAGLAAAAYDATISTPFSLAKCSRTRRPSVRNSIVSRNCRSIDGSGFSGLPLTGTLAGALGPASGMDVAALAALGQMGAVWTGGGTLIAWSSLIAVAGFARVNVLEVARALLIPVVLGLIAAVLTAVALWG